MDGFPDKGILMREFYVFYGYVKSSDELINPLPATSNPVSAVLTEI